MPPVQPSGSELWDAGTWFELASGQAHSPAPTAPSAGFLSRSATSRCFTSGPASSIRPKRSSERRPRTRVGRGAHARGGAAGGVARRPAPQTQPFEEMVVAGSRRGEGVILTYIEFVKSVLYNAQAEYDRAAKAAYSAVGTNEFVISYWRFPNWWRPRCERSADRAARGL